MFKPLFRKSESWGYTGVALTCRGLSLTLLWPYCALPSLDIALNLHWPYLYHGFSLPWRYLDHPLTLLWPCLWLDLSLMKIPWPCLDFALTMSWFCPGLALTMPKCTARGKTKARLGQGPEKIRTRSGQSQCKIKARSRQGQGKVMAWSELKIFWYWDGDQWLDFLEGNHIYCIIQ